MGALTDLAARVETAVTAAGLDPQDLDVTFHISGAYRRFGIAGGTNDYTADEAARVAHALGGQVDGPPGDGFLHRRVAGIGVTIDHAKTSSAIPGQRASGEKPCVVAS